MTPQEIAAYNEKHNLAGKPNELLQVVNSRNGKMEILTRKNLALVKGFRLYEPTKAPTPIDVKDLSDDVLAIERERQRLAQENAELKAQISQSVSRETKKVGRPRKEGIQKTSDA